MPQLEQRRPRELFGPFLDGLARFSALAFNRFWRARLAAADADSAPFRLERRRMLRFVHDELVARAARKFRLLRRLRPNRLLFRGKVRSVGRRLVRSVDQLPPADGLALP